MTEPGATDATPQLSTGLLEWPSSLQLSQVLREASLGARGILPAWTIVGLVRPTAGDTPVLPLVHHKPRRSEAQPR